jgi:tRNA dimethylallyltransferase
MNSTRAPAAVRLPFAIALAGPTASGKTAAAFAIAAHLAPRQPVEIISVDSALVYRGMDVGTAKPTPTELAGVPHHLIDIRDPLQAYSAAEFVADAERLMADITARGRLPLLVGGTMLYFKALFEGLDPMPRADPATRAALEAEAAVAGWPAMHAELARVDPATAARLQPADAQRVQRALEVYRVSGQPLSAFHSDKGDAARAARAERVTLLSLEPQDRAWLHQRIAERFDAMLAAGLVDEVRRLRARGDLGPDLPSMRCVGYRQAWAALELAPVDGILTPVQNAALRDQGIFATRQLAKRQLTWLRGMPHRLPVAADAPDALPQVLARVDQALAQRTPPP